MAPMPKRTAEAVATRLAAALRAAERARSCTAARLRLAHSYSMANTASASAITTRPGPGATKSTTPTARITVPTTVTAIRRSSLTRSFISASMPSTPPVLPRATASERDGGGPVGERSHLVGYLRVHRGRQVVPDPGQDDEPGTGDRRGGAPRGGGAQQRILRAVQDQGRHPEPRQPAAVPFRAGLTALGRGVADAADLVPFGHPAYFLLVGRIGR